MTSVTTSQPAKRDLSAAILAGGASRRMGTDKALLTLAGQTLLERAVASAARVADDVVIVGDRRPYHQLGVTVVADAFPGTGALGGIATALRHARHEYVLIVACDMPFLSAKLLEAMASQPRDFDALVPVTATSRNSEGGRQTYETLHAIYRRTCLAPFERRIEIGKLAIVAALDDVRVRELPEDWTRYFDPELDSFVNTNHPAEWEAAKARLGDGTSSVEG